MLGRKSKPNKLYSWSQGIRYHLDHVHTILIKLNRVFIEVMGALERELKPLEPIARAGGNTGHETYDSVRKSQERSFNLSDFGIREFSDNDDWITMKPGSQK